MKLLCIIKGHDWIMVGTSQYCLRCSKSKDRQLQSRQPVSTLDEIIHDDWYSPRKKRTKSNNDK